VDALVADGGGSSTLLGVGGAHLVRARAANAALVGAPTLPAWRRYTGVVFDGLSPATLPPAARRAASDSVVIVSGLLGLVGWDDPLPDYRLKMGARLAPFGLLSTWWREAVGAQLDDWVRGRTVIDLLPGEHRAAWRPDPSIEVVRVSFVERSGKVAGHDAKNAKGQLARHLLTSRRAPLKALEGFEHERFDLRFE
jgi:cytoplasmic iron level regulating protein YaaA (DUF328/UPF0246 family)